MFDGGKGDVFYAGDSTASRQEKSGKDVQKCLAFVNRDL
jgi:hypothetical protein